MNWKYQLGAFGSRVLGALLSSRWLPLTRYFPRGISWAYDLQRFIGRRSLGVVFDVGANSGQTLVNLLRYAPRAQIYSFEPASDIFAVLRQRFAGLPNVHLFNMALGAAADRMPLRLSADSLLNTLVPDPSRPDDPTSQMVDVGTVDAIVAAHGISHVDLLKVDVEGWELEVMRGAASLIADRNLLFVFAEVSFRSDLRQMQQFGALHGHLENNGFALCGLYDLLRYGPRKEFVLYANALYVNPEARLKWTDIGSEWHDWLARQTPAAGPAVTR